MSVDLIIRRAHRNNGYMLTLPNGDICWQPSKDFAEKYAKTWLAEHPNVEAKIKWEKKS